MWKKFKIWIIAFFLGSACLAAPIGLEMINNDILSEHKLKIHKNEILQEIEVDWIKCTGKGENLKCKNKGKIKRYFYYGEDVATNTLKHKGKILDEDIEKRTNVSKSYNYSSTTTVTEVFGETFSFLKDGDKWKHIEDSTTTIKAYDKQIARFSIKDFFVKKVLATTVYPVPGTTVDGRTMRNAVDETFSTIRAGAGTNSSYTDTETSIPRIDCSTTNDQYAVLMRGIFVFATGVIPDTDSIDSAVFSLHIVSKVDDLKGSSSDNSKIVLVESDPANDDVLVDADYGQLKAVDFGRSVKQESLATSTYNDITLNSDGLANISTTDNSRFGIMYAWDFDNTTTGIIWLSNSGNTITPRLSDYTGTAQDPKLTIVHSGDDVDTDDQIILFN